MQTPDTRQSAIIKNHMARVFWHWHSISSARVVCIC